MWKIDGHTMIGRTPHLCSWIYSLGVRGTGKSPFVLGREIQFFLIEKDVSPCKQKPENTSMASEGDIHFYYHGTLCCITTRQTQCSPCRRINESRVALLSAMDENRAFVTELPEGIRVTPVPMLRDVIWAVWVGSKQAHNHLVLLLFSPLSIAGRSSYRSRFKNSWTTPGTGPKWASSNCQLWPFYFLKKIQIYLKWIIF